MAVVMKSIEELNLIRHNRINIHGLPFYLPDLTSFLPDVRNDFSKVRSFIKFMQILCLACFSRKHRTICREKVD